MHCLEYLMLIITFSSGMAHYRGSYESRNLIPREEPAPVEAEIVECPVCEQTEDWSAPTEECHIKKANKSYKICHFGTYTNELCGKRTDCYRGPDEVCTEKRDLDSYGIKCARGLYCHKWKGVCIRHDVRPENWQAPFVPFNRQIPLREQSAEPFFE